MATERQIRANRINARSSTGPRTVSGRAAVSQNAYRHGLSRSSPGGIEAEQSIRSLALGIAGDAASPQALELAEQISSAEFDVQRVRQLKAALLSEANAGESRSWSRVIDDLRKLDRYEQSARVRRRQAILRLHRPTD